jgi:TetR/AcrR family transcriptional regulator, transcriptional repressor for nem operon
MAGVCLPPEYVQEHIEMLRPANWTSRMPYPPHHKQLTRRRIVEAARILFNRHGFDRVSIDMVMAEAGLTRGGFYAHFESKEALFAAAVDSFLMGRGLEWRGDAGISSTGYDPETARRMVDAYLSDEHLADLDGQCPLIALSTDVARAGEEVRSGYERLLVAMIRLFETNLDHSISETRASALALSALLVGGMIIARTLPDSAVANEVREAAHLAARSLVGDDARAARAPK